MKRIIGIIAVVLLSILVGLSVDRLCDGEVTLVSEYSFEIGGVYD